MSARATRWRATTAATAPRLRWDRSRHPLKERTMFPSRAVARLLLLASLLVVPASRASEDPSADRTLSPYFFVEGADSGTDRVPLLGTNVHVEIAGVVAHVSVRQSYQNDGTRPIHARYVFPASTRAAVHGLTMTL